MAETRNQDLRREITQMISQVIADVEIRQQNRLQETQERMQQLMEDLKQLISELRLPQTE